MDLNHLLPVNYFILIGVDAYEHTLNHFLILQTRYSLLLSNLFEDLLCNFLFNFLHSLFSKFQMAIFM